MEGNMKIFGREPSFWVTIIGAVLAFLVTYNLNGLTDVQAAAIMGVLVAAVGALNGWITRPRKPGVFNGLLAAVVGLLAAYGLKMGADQVAALDAMLLAIGGLWAIRPQVTPAADPAPTTPTDGVIR
jgi:uncharacterized membrane protein